jgi:hypothetical protein
VPEPTQIVVIESNQSIDRAPTVVYTCIFSLLFILDDSPTLPRPLLHHQGTENHYYLLPIERSVLT